jgi:hypothetical protein
MYEFNNFQKRWLAALRSGRYEQGKGFLQKGNQYCCLGVACDIFADRFDISKIKDGDITLYNHSRQRLPPQLIAALGLRDAIGMFSGPIQYGDCVLQALAGMNDSGKFTFAEIADFIEQHPTTVFNPSIP